MTTYTQYTLKDTVKNLIKSEFKTKRFTVKDIMDCIDYANIGSVRTCITRDLVKTGFITKLEDVSRGKFNLYKYINPEKEEETIEVKTEKEVIPIQRLNYVDIGAAIEILIESKNNDIAKLKEEVKQLKLEAIDKDGMIQERDRHITEQGKKIHELNEQIRKRSGGTIKLDELQELIKI